MARRKCPIDPDCSFWELEEYTYSCKFVECCLTPHPAVEQNAVKKIAESELKITPSVLIH